MELINGINEVTHPILIIIPLVLVAVSGHTVGIGISKFLRTRGGLLENLLYGNVLLNFIFVVGFIIFGVLTSAANDYFVVFTYLTFILSGLGVYHFLRSIVAARSRIKISLLYDNKYVLFGVSLFLPLVVFQGVIIYYHPIFAEYDSIYVFLPISKSILLGNGLNHDFYLGSDVAIQFPPFTQALNAWLMHSFGYSSLRLFPVYFVFFASMFVYVLARKLTKDSFLGLIAASAFLITPAMLIISSRFSLQQDLAFIFILAAGLYFSLVTIRNATPRRIHLLLLLVSLSLMSLSREIGLTISIAIFFLIPAIKFTKGNIWLRAIFTISSFLPLYSLIVYDILNDRFTISATIRLVSLLVANCAIFYVVCQIKNQQQFKLLFPSGFIYLFIIIVPLFFFANNLISIGGPFSTFVFSSQYAESIAIYRDVFEISKDPDLVGTLQQNLPRVDILLVSSALGSLFVFFRLRGFIRLIEAFKNNNYFAVIIALTIVLLIIWSYLLESGFVGPRIRHIAYFLPITTVLVVLGMNRKETFPRLFYYGTIVFCTYYFLNFNLEIWNYNNHFGGFWLEPFKDSTMGWIDFIIAGAIILPPLIYEYREKTISVWSSKYNFSKYTTPVFLILLCIQLYLLYSSGLFLYPLAIIDQNPPSGWESNVFETVNFLKKVPDKGNILSLRAPAISFFTNYTNYDLYNHHTFSSIFPLLLTEKNATLLKEKMGDMNIKYIIIPNEESSFYSLAQNLNKSSTILQLIERDEAFEKISLRGFNIYVFRPSELHFIDLLDEKKVWKPFGEKTFVSSKKGNLDIGVFATQKEKIFNRAYLNTDLNFTGRPLVLSLDYISHSLAGNGTFYAEIRDMNQKPIWGVSLGETDGKTRSESFVLPDQIGRIPLEFRFYVITEGIGQHILGLKKANLIHS